MLGKLIVNVWNAAFIIKLESSLLVLIQQVKISEIKKARTILFVLKNWMLHIIDRYLANEKVRNKSEVDRKTVCCTILSK